MTATAVLPQHEAPTKETPKRETPRWWLNWLGPVLVTLLGGALRLWDLGRPHAVVFDETYYAKDALSLLRFGHERGAVDGANELLLNGNGDPASAEIFTDTGSFVVHPPVGKWLIAAGEWAFGATPFGWRFTVAVLGTLSILMLARIVWNLSGSPLWGTVAGLLLAIDGVGIVMSRTVVLDGILAFFVLAAFGALVADRTWVRKPVHNSLRWSWWRPWRMVAAVTLGLACGVKWSGLWFLAAFAVLTVLWDVSRRRRQGQPIVPAFLADAIPAAISILGIAFACYVISWTGWLVTSGGWGRDWAGGSGILDSLRALWHYHDEILNFHTGLTTEHSYQSSAWGWLVQARPTSFFFESSATSCASDNCAQEVIALGNPVIWWAATVSMAHQTWRWFAHRDWRSGAILLGILAGWVPWLLNSDRTIFSFYTVAILPFLIASLTLSLAALAGSYAKSDSLRTNPYLQPRAVLVAAFLIVCVAVSWWFYPIWSAEIIDYTSWSSRMWLPTWI